MTAKIGKTKAVKEIVPEKVKEYGIPREKLEEPMDLQERPRGFHDMMESAQRIATRAIAVGAIAMSTAFPAIAAVRTVDSLNQVKRDDQIVVLDQRGNPLRGKKGITVFEKSTNPEILREGFFKVGLKREGDGGVIFGVYLDPDVTGPLYLVPGNRISDIRDDLIRQGSTNKVPKYENIGTEPVDIGGKVVWGPFVLINADKTPQVDLSGGHSIVINPRDTRGSTPIIFVDRDIRRGEVPMEVLQEIQRQQMGELGREYGYRRSDIARDRAYMWRWMQRGLDLPDVPIQDPWVRDVQREIERRTREQARRGFDAETWRIMESERGAYERARRAQDARLLNERERRQLLDQLVVPVGLVAAENVVFPGRGGEAILPVDKISWTNQLTGNPDTLNILIGKRLSADEREAVRDRLTRGQEIMENGLRDDNNRVARAEQPGGYYIVRVRDLWERGRETGGVISISRGYLKGPYHIMPAESLAHNLDQMLYERFYSNVNGPIPAAHVEQTLYQLADLDNDGVVTAGEMTMFIAGYNSTSVERTMRGLGEGVQPVRYITDPQELGVGGGFILINDKPSPDGKYAAIQTEKGIAVYPSYASAYVAQQEQLKNQTTKTHIVGSFVLDRDAKWRTERALSDGHMPVAIVGEDGKLKGIVDVPFGTQATEGRDTAQQISGHWSSPGPGWGEITIEQKGTKITGTYVHDNGKIEGEYNPKDKRWDFRWREEVKPGEDSRSTSGDGYFTVSDDGKKLTLRWRGQGEKEFNRTGTSSRIG